MVDKRESSYFNVFLLEILTAEPAAINTDVGTAVFKKKNQFHIIFKITINNIKI